MDEQDLQFFKHLLERVDSTNTRIDDMNKNFTEMVKIQSAQHEVLKEHTRRSLSNEKAVDLIAKELKPLQLHVANMQVIGKILLWGAGSGGLVFLVLKQFFSALL